MKMAILLTNVFAALQHQFITKRREIGPDGSWMHVLFENEYYANGSSIVLKFNRTNLQDDFIIKVTSLKDSYYQYLDKDSLIEWNYQSAIFNGNRVLYQILGHNPSSIEWPEVVTVESMVTQASNSICHQVDQRRLSNDTRTARMGGCTVFVVDDGCFLTAGHCHSSNWGVIEFNAPFSNEDGSINHPKPQDQFYVDPSSVQYKNIFPTGNDWMYFGVFPNSITKKTPLEQYGQKYKIKFELPSVGTNLSITGYGITKVPFRIKNQVQQTHEGILKFYTNHDRTLKYRIDTSSCNSGSPVFDNDGSVIAIHTQAGCNSVFPWTTNYGTVIATNPDLLKALKNPSGVCAKNMYKQITEYEKI